MAMRQGPWIVITLLLCCAFVQAQSTEVFTYQGLLREGNQPAVGNYYIRFDIWDGPSGGDLLLSTFRSVEFTEEDAGRFTVHDLPADAFDIEIGGGRWLEIGVAPFGVDPTDPAAYTPIGPRQMLTAAPFARYSERSGMTPNAIFQNGSTISLESTNISLFSSSVAPGIPLVTVGPSFGVPGMSFKMFGDTGDRFALLEPDDEGYGADFRLEGGAGGYLRFRGDGGFYNSPTLFLEGDQSSVFFDTNYSGDGSVTLPTSAVSSSEMLNEAGLMMVRNSFGVSGSTAIDTYDFEVIASASIFAPSPGYILALGSAQVETLQYEDGSSGQVTLTYGISDTTTAFLPGSTVQFDFRGPRFHSGWSRSGGSVHGVFQVNSAGVFTYHLLGELSITGGQAGPTRIDDPQLTLIYIPTAYGSVTTQNDPADSSAALSTPNAGVGTGQRDDVYIKSNNSLRSEIKSLRDELEAQRRLIERLLRESDTK